MLTSLGVHCFMRAEVKIKCRWGVVKQMKSHSPNPGPSRLIWGTVKVPSPRQRCRLPVTPRAMGELRQGGFLFPKVRAATSLGFLTVILD